MNDRILLVDDHSLFRAGLRALLQASHSSSVIDEAGTGAGALDLVQKNAPGLVIMDLHLPDQNGLEITKQILAKHPPAKVIVLSGESDLSYVNEALQCGVAGYLLKSNAPAELHEALRAVTGGQTYLCADANKFILDEYRRSLQAGSAVAHKPALSVREKDVLRLVTEGLRSKEIADRMGISVKTVETYRRRLSKKLNASSTAELVRYALREGIVTP